MCTYPIFFTGPNQELVFNYRSENAGTAGGSSVLVKYDTVTKAYQTNGLPLFTWPATYGGYNMYSVYPIFTVNGGYLHSLYVWRTKSGTDNFRLSYVRSADMVNWTDAFGRNVTLPLGPNDTLQIVDDVPHQSGLLNGQPKLGFDMDGVPLVTYSRYDAQKHSQVYVARPNPATTNWTIVQLTTNNYWGMIPNNVGTVNPAGSVGNGFVSDDPDDGLVTISVSMTDLAGVRDPNSGVYTLDEQTLARVDPSGKDTGTFNSGNPAPLAVANSVDIQGVQNTYLDTNRNYSAMEIHRASSGGVGFANLHYYMRWEALPENNSYQTKYDQNGIVINPPPSPLWLYRTAADFDDSIYGVMFKPANANVFGAMTRTVNSARTFGTTLASPVTGNNNFAEWNFNVATAGNYALAGSTYSPLGTNGSFYVQVDNGPLLDWRVSGYWNYQAVATGVTKGLMRFKLTVGSHTLRLYAQQPGTRLEYLWLNLPNTAKAPSLAPVSYSGFTLTADARAVSGYSLNSPLGSTPTNSTAHYEVPVAQGGNYLLLGRTRAPSASADTFWLSVNGGAQQLWTLSISGTNWVWKVFGTPLTIIAGTLSLDVTGREGGAELDSFMLLKIP